MRERNRKGIGVKKRAKRGEQEDESGKNERGKKKKKEKVKKCKPARLLAQEEKEEFKKQVNLFEKRRKAEVCSGSRFHSYSFLFSPSEAIVFEVMKQNGEIKITGFLFTAKGNYITILKDSIACEGSSKKAVIANCRYDDSTLMLKYDIRVVRFPDRKEEKRIYREGMILSEADNSFTVEDILTGKKRFSFLPPVHGESYLHQIRNN